MKTSIPSKVRWSRKRGFSAVEVEYEDFSSTGFTDHDHLLRIGPYQDRKLMWSEGYLRFRCEEGPLKDELKVFLGNGDSRVVYEGRSERGPGDCQNEVKLDSEETKAFKFILEKLEEDREQPPQLDQIVERMEESIERYSEGYPLTQ